MKIIELSGKAGVGKDTFGMELAKQLEQKGYRCIHIAFADRLKDICMRYFNWDGKKDEAGRHLLQYIGTDVFRRNNPNFWVDDVIKFLAVCRDEDLFDYVIITDARFPNEIEEIRKNLQSENCTVLAFRIERLNFESKLNAHAQSHLSEKALDNFDLHKIVLSGDIQKLPYETERAIEEWQI